MSVVRNPFYWDVREYSKAAQAYLGIENHNHDPIVDQGIFAFGDPGTESGHALDTSSVDRTTTVDGAGNYAFFLRINLNQTRTTQDQNLTDTYKLQYDKDGAASWTDVTASSSNVQVVADGNITDGAATSERIGGTGATFLAGEYDEGDGTLDSITWTTGGTEYTEMLWSLQVIDADMAAGATLDFRVIETGGTVLNNDATSDKPRLTWNAGAAAYSITGDVTVNSTIAAGMAYNQNPSITGDITVVSTIAAGMVYGAGIVGDVTVSVSIAGGMDYTFIRSITGDITHTFTIGSGMVYTPVGGTPSTSYRNAARTGAFIGLM